MRATSPFVLHTNVFVRGCSSAKHYVSTYTDTILASAVAVNDSKDRVLLAPEQLLAQCDDDDALALIEQVKTKLTHRYCALNAHQCRLLDLPPELLERIGKFVIHSSQASPSKFWFTTGIFPLLQTCSSLRTQLELIRQITLTYYIMTDQPWVSRMRADVKDWRQNGFHKGPNRIAVATPSIRYKPSISAARARALECTLYGDLSETSGCLHRIEYYIRHYQKGEGLKVLRVPHSCRKHAPGISR